MLMSSLHYETWSHWRKMAVWGFNCEHLYLWKSQWGSQSTENIMYRGADKFLARPGRKQTTATEDFYVHVSYL